MGAGVSMGERDRGCLVPVRPGLASLCVCRDLCDLLSVGPAKGHPRTCPVQGVRWEAVGTETGDSGQGGAPTGPEAAGAEPGRPGLPRLSLSP